MPRPTETADKVKLQGYLLDLVERIMEAPELHNTPNEVGEPPQAPKLDDVRNALREVARVYGLLYRTGDFEQSGGGLDGYREVFHGGANQGSGGNGRSRRRTSTSGTGTA